MAGFNFGSTGGTGFSFGSSAAPAATAVATTTSSSFSFGQSGGAGGSLFGGGGNAPSFGSTFGNIFWNNFLYLACIADIETWE